MSKLQRTPPGSNSKVLQTSSENDLSNLDAITFDYVGRRPKKQKRAGVDDEKCEEKSLKEELLNMLTEWKRDQDQTLKTLITDIAVLKQQNSNIQSTTYELEKSIQFISKQYDDMKEKLITMETERKQNLIYVKSLEDKIDDLEKKSKSTVIEFRNLPTTPQLKLDTQQDLSSVVQKICGTFDVNINLIDIKDIFRIKTRTGTSTVVTEFSSTILKNNVLSNAREFNKKNMSNKLSTASIGLPSPVSPIYVAESLTNKNRKLFALARDKAKSFGFKYCWTNNGRVFLKKKDGDQRVEIKHENDLTALRGDD